MSERPQPPSILARLASVCRDDPFVRSYTPATIPAYRMKLMTVLQDIQQERGDAGEMPR